MQANEHPTVWQLLIVRCFIIRCSEGLATQEKVREDSVGCNISLPAAQSKLAIEAWKHQASESALAIT